MQYRREVDGLRALAVLPVILFHAGFQTFSGGFVGVDVFFVISGYLITSIIVDERKSGTFTFANFYERRARRILPALFIVMLTCLPFAWFWLLPEDMRSFARSLAAVTVFSSNILFWRQSGYFDASAELTPLLHTWSLAVEEQYYVFFPIFLILVWNMGRRIIFTMLAIIAVASLLLAQWASYALPSAAFFLLPTRGWEILIGALAAFYLAEGYRWPLRPLASEVGACIGFAMLCYSVIEFDQQTPFPSAYTLMPVIGTALIILCATEVTLIGKLLGHRILVGIGLISYSTYLWHQPLFAFARHRSVEAPGTLLLCALIAAAIAMAFLSWRYVEMPFRSKRNFSRKQIFIFGGIGSALFAMLGLLGAYTKGYAFPYRFDQKDQYLTEITLKENVDYVTHRFDNLSDKEFDSRDSRRKILLIGDSYAQDLTNAFFEADFNSRMQLSTRHVSKECGNLFLSSELLMANVPSNKRAECKATAIYSDQKLRKRMQEADEVWLASSWQLWQAKLIAKSVADLQLFSEHPVKVFGRKNFGPVNIRNILEMPAEVRYKTIGQVPIWQLEVNDQLKANLPKAWFIDVQGMLCEGSQTECLIFIDREKIKTFDGAHLTRGGAKYLGDRLLNNSLLMGSFEAR
jgi:peptidoglycan/LPS O-acetylase OafA/YrhL